jgi:hypothetical protein
MKKAQAYTFALAGLLGATVACLYSSGSIYTSSSHGMDGELISKSVFIKLPNKNKIPKPEFVATYDFSEHRFSWAIYP